MRSLKLNLIAACDKKMGIGKDGGLPWKLKNEMAYFNKMTRHVTSDGNKNVVIMGRKTWESIPTKFKPLPGRLNVVISRTLASKPENALLFGNLDEAIKELDNNQKDIEKIWIIGGFGIYKEAMEHSLCDKVYLTEIDGDFNCDTFFPQLSDEFTLLTDHADEKELVPIDKQEENGMEYYFKIYQKK